MLKKTLISLSVIIVLLTAGLRSMSISPLALGDAMDVATSMGAKIACSGKFNSALSEQQVVQDLAAYSVATKLLSFVYTENSVTTDFIGLSTSSATYRRGLGCTLDYAQPLVDLDGLSAPQYRESSLLWPAGETVNSIEPTMQMMLDRLLDQDNQNNLDSRALLVVKDGQIIAESYADGFSYNTPILGWSMGKSLTSILLGNMALKQKVQIDQSHLFASWLEDERQNITLESLLQMTSGLDFDETYIPGSDATRMLFLQPSASSYALEKPAEYEVGRHFMYSSGTTNILMRFALQVLDGEQQQLIDYFYQQVAKPLGLSNTIFEVDAEGIFVGSSYIFASARDWARMGLLMVNQGHINNQQVLSQEWVAAAQQPNSSENDPRYGYQFWLNSGAKKLRWPDLPASSYAMSGSKNQRVMMIPSHNVVIVRLGWSSGYPVNENFAKVLAALE